MACCRRVRTVLRILRSVTLLFILQGLATQFARGSSDVESEPIDEQPPTGPHHRIPWRLLLPLTLMIFPIAAMTWMLDYDAGDLPPSAIEFIPSSDVAADGHNIGVTITIQPGLFNCPPAKVAVIARTESDPADGPIAVRIGGRGYATGLHSVEWVEDEPFSPYVAEQAPLLFIRHSWIESFAAERPNSELYVGRRNSEYHPFPVNPVQVVFLADWTQWQSFGVCSVSLPRLSGNTDSFVAGESSRDDGSGLMEENPPIPGLPRTSRDPEHASVEMVVENGILDRNATTLQPDKVRSLIWECGTLRTSASSEASHDCDVAATVTRRGADRILNIAIFVLAGLFSVGTQGLYDWFRHYTSQ